MVFTWFCFFERPGGVLDESDHRALLERLRRLPGLAEGRLYTPAAVATLFKDGPGPMLALQLYFATLPALEAALAHLPALAALPSLHGAAISHQAMVARSFPVPDARITTSTPCTFLVHYPGPAQDVNAWLRHYIAHHTPLMAKFPGIRDIEVCTRVDWCDALPWPRADHMQRNRVVFDSTEALAAALASPVLAELRADSRSLPPFSGGSRHYPMHTTIVVPA
jgi:uncharacterized protein (TIGR02118 family)